MCGCVALLLTLWSDPAVAFSTGQVQHSGSPDVGGATCANCHTGGESAASISISAPSSVQVGETTTVTVSISGGPAAVAGFNAAFAGQVGSLTPVSADVQISAGEATHSAPQTIVGGQATFSFTWTAPSEAGTADLYVAAVSANGNGVTSGDSVASTTASIQIAPEPTPTPTVSVSVDPSLRSGVTTEATPVPTAAPVANASASHTGTVGDFGFGLNPQAGAASDAAPDVAVAAEGARLAVTGSESPALTALALVMLATGATFAVTARRSR